MAKTIYFEGLGLVEGHFSGVGQYILGILRGIDSIIDEEAYAGRPTPRVVVIIPYNSVGRFLSYNFKHIEYKRLPLSFRAMSALWRRRWLPPIDLWCGRGVYIFPRFVSMPLLFSKSALVIFDLSYELYRQYSDEGNALFLSKQVRRSLVSSKQVIAISQHAKKEIVDFYKLAPTDVHVATPATDPQTFYRRSPSQIQRVKEKYHIEGDYILALSNLEPRKNLEALVDVYCKLPKTLVKNTSLLLVGVSGWKTEALFSDIIHRVEQGHKIIRPSKYVLDEDKAAIISGAKLLVYPSHYEGFGMPPLEALACGVPVITADNSSLPEVVGKTAQMVSSEDREQLLATLSSSLESIDSLTEKTITAGPKQAAKFSWENSGQVFLDVARGLDS